jgi:2-oxoisovalerate dehydrogenase E2 component (dihydrolipoyl transacylase)
VGRYVFKLPDMGEGTAEAELVAWHVAVGDRVKEEQAIADVMTEKATMEIPAPVAGMVVELAGVPGEMLAVGSDLIVFEVDGSGNADASATLAKAQLAAANPATQATAPTPAQPRKEPAELASATASGAGRYVVKLPDIGEGTVEAELVAWYVKVGDTIKEEQHVADVMTEKATVELPSPATGRVISLTGVPGSKIAVGSELLVLEVAGTANLESPAAHPNAPSRAPEPDVAKPAAGSAKPRPAAAPSLAVGAGNGKAASLKFGFATQTPGEKPVASPAVRRRALELGVKLQFVGGSGPGGRITHDDLDQYVASGGAVAMGGWVSPALARKDGVEEVKVIGLRRRIAEKMQEAKRRIPHFSYIEEVDVTALEDLRTHLNATKNKEQPKLTLLPFLMRAMVRSLAHFPQINARFDDDAGVVHRYEGVHIGIATQTPTGLVVPVVRHAEVRDIWDAATELARLAAAAREGKATRDELSGSTITITSLGTLGGIATTPVINHPEVAIVGVNKMCERPMVRDGQIVVRKMMNLSSSFDHRVVDGVDAAEFIQQVRGFLEQPATLFMD